jgi:hypothetical protein
LFSLDLKADMMFRVLFPVTMFIAAALFASPPDQFAQDSAQLDHLEKVFASTPQFGDAFWRESKRVADRVGPHIIHTLMKRSKKWHDEELLVFVPLVALLPREPALKLLRQYDRDQSHQGLANEFLFELNMPDVKDGVRKFGGR